VTGQPPWRVQWRFIIAVLALAGAWLAMLFGGAGAVDRAI